MGRKKKPGKSEVELSLVTEETPAEEVPAEESEAEGAEALSANEDAAPEDDNATGTISREEVEAEAAVEEASTPRRRRSRAKKAEESVAASEAGTADPERGAVVKHWEAIQNITDSITKNFEKISQQLQEISLHAPSAPAIIERPISPKVTLLNRVTLGVSAAALVVGLVGISLSQSVRERMLRNSSEIQTPDIQAKVLEPKTEAPIDSVAKKPSEFTRRQKELWRMRKGN